MADFILLDFRSKKIRVNLNLPIKAEVKAESADVLKNVDEDRKYVIQATIVRYVSRLWCRARVIDRCHIQDYESTEDYEEPAAYPGGDLTNLAAVRAEDPGHQEGRQRLLPFRERRLMLFLCPLRR